MSENLKVNSKTQILEFKRKHNDLVDSIPTSEDIEEIAEEVVEDTFSSVESGTIANALGLDSEGKLIKGTISGGTQLYLHYITFDEDDYGNINGKFVYITLKSNPLVDIPTQTPSSTAANNVIFVTGEYQSGGSYFQVFAEADDQFVALNMNNLTVQVGRVGQPFENFNDTVTPL